MWFLGLVVGAIVGSIGGFEGAVLGAFVGIMAGAIVGSALKRGGKDGAAVPAGYQPRARSRDACEPGCAHAHAVVLTVRHPRGRFEDRSEQRCEREVLPDDMWLEGWKVGRRRFAVERTGAALAQMPHGKPEHALRAGCAREDRRLEEPLEINCRVVAARAKQGDRAHPGLQRPRLEHDARVDGRDETHDALMRSVDEPVDARVGHRAAQGGDRRHRVNDVAERSEPHDEHAHQDFSRDAAMRTSRSRVE